MTAPNAFSPPHCSVAEPVARCAQVALSEKKNTPPTTTTIPANLATVNANCTRPPTATPKQLMSEKQRITATATSCCMPKFQENSCPNILNAYWIQTVPMGRRAERKVANARLRAAIEPVASIETTVQP